MASNGLALPSVAHQHDSLQVRHQHLRRIHGVAEGELIDGSRDIGSRRQSSGGRLVDPGKNHRRSGPQLRSIPNSEFKRRRSLGDQDADRPLAKLLSEISAQDLIVSRAPEAAEIEVLRIDGNPFRGFSIQC
jgi:hypothetical protein